MTIDREINVSIEECEEATVNSFEIFKEEKVQRLQEAVDYYTCNQQSSVEIQNLDVAQQQDVIFREIERRLNKVKEDDRGNVQRGVLISGPPGCGKTHVALHAMQYALANGLLCDWTALSANCASRNGGIHLHRLFKFIVPRTNHKPHPTNIANSALNSLLRDNNARLWLQSVHCIFIDEVFFVASYYLIAMDIILRSLRNTPNTPFGGIFIVLLGDQFQTRPVKGQFFLSTTLFREWMNIYNMQGNARALQGDPVNDILRLLRNPRKLQKNETDEIVATIFNNCNFATTPDPLRPGIVVFAKRKDVEDIQSAFLNTVDENDKHTFTAVDYVSTSSSSWKEMNDVYETHRRNRSALDTAHRKAAPRCVTVAQGEHYFVTKNIPGTHPPLWNGTVVEVVSFTLESVEVRVLDNNYCNTTTIRKATFPTVQGRSCRLKRQQIPLSSARATSIHDVQGLTVNHLYASFTGLFDRSLLYVCISRVKSSHDLTILLPSTTSREITYFLSATIYSLLQKVDPELIVVNDFIEKNNILQPSQQPSTETCEYNLPATRQLFPSTGEPVVYVITDHETQQISYIGFSRNLQSRYRTHTRGHDKRTKDFAPWDLFFFVAGFPYENQLTEYSKKWGKELAGNVGINFERNV